MRASDELDARIEGPRWSISAGNPAWLEAASQAERARGMAAAYAAGVGARLGALIELSEPEQHGSAGRFALRAAALSDMNIDPGEPEVVARIRATFELRLGEPGSGTA